MQEPELSVYCHTTLLTELQIKKRLDAELRNSLFPRLDPELIWTLIREGDLTCKHRRFEDGEMRYQVFDWGNDPAELHDLYDPADPRHARLVEKLAAYRARLIQNFPSRKRRSQDTIPEEEQLERLRALGYVK